MRALFAAYADRLAVRRAPGDRRGVMVGGRGVRLADESSVLEHELFVCVDMDAGKRGERAEALVRQASAVERAWVDPASLRTETHVEFDREKQRVTASRRTMFERPRPRRGSGRRPGRRCGRARARDRGG